MVEAFDSNHTIYAEREALNNGLLFKDPETGEMHFGSPEGRLTIGRLDLVKGRVDIRGWGTGGEAIIVDETALTKPGYDKLRRAYQEELADVTVTSSGISERQYLDAIYQSVKNTMVYDLKATQKIYGEDFLEGELRKANLGDYLLEGKGVCRHMALAVAWLGQNEAEAGRLNGVFTAGVNQIHEIGAHEWGRYESRDGAVYILDPAQQFFGTLEDAYKRAREAKEGKREVWDYFRPGEKMAYQVRYEAKNIVRLSREPEQQPERALSRTDLEQEFGEIYEKSKGQTGEVIKQRKQELSQKIAKYINQTADRLARRIQEYPNAENVKMLENLNNTLYGMIRERFEKFENEGIDMKAAPRGLEMTALRQEISKLLKIASAYGNNSNNEEYGSFPYALIGLGVGLKIESLLTMFNAYPVNNAA